MANSAAAFRNRLIRVFTLWTALALLAAAALTLSPAHAAPPDDLALRLSLVEDSDNIAPPDSTVQVAAALTFSGRAAHLANVPSGTLRVSGNQEWESGRNSLRISRQPGFTATTFIGESVAVQEDPDGDIVVVGAPTTTADGIRGAGAVDVYVGGKFAARLIGEPTLNAAPQITVGRGGIRWDSSILQNGAFGASVDVANGVIVVGAPSDGARTSVEDGHILIDHEPGAVYVFERNDDGTWARTAKLTVGTSVLDRPDRDINRLHLRFGHSVAISDDGATIVVGQQPLSYLQTPHHWGATGHVFTRPSNGWSDMTTDNSTVVSLRYDGDDQNTDPDDAASAASRDATFGDVDISGDGSLVALGGMLLPTNDNIRDSPGAVLIFKRPDAGWSDAGGPDGMLEQDATLSAEEDGPRSTLVGEALAINGDGSVIVSSGSGVLAAWFDAEQSQRARDWSGAAFVWAKPAGEWADTNDATATLSDSTALAGDLFGITVAVSDSGDQILVGDNIDDSLHVFRKSAAGWVDDASADLVLFSRRVADVWRPSARPGVALDGESTAVLGQTSRTRVSDARLVHTGRVLALNIAGADPQTSATLLASCSNEIIDGLTTWTCPVDAGGTRIEIPPGTPEGTFTISGTLTIDGVQYTDTLEVAIAAVDEVVEVQFDFAPHDSSDRRGELYPSSIEIGETTRLRLHILNEHGKAAAANSIASILITTTTGSLSTAIGGGCENGGGTVCQIPVSAITAANADRIDLTLTHPGGERSGAAQIRAAVVAADGESFTPEPISVVFVGGAATLTLSEPTTTVLNVSTADSGLDRDDRDLLLLAVTAVDENSRKATVPIRSVHVALRGPEGRTMEVDPLWNASATTPVRFAWPFTNTQLQAHLGAPTTASQLLGAYDAVGKWETPARRWRFYGVNADNKPLDGAVDFTASRGDTLRFDNFIRDADGNLQVLIDIDAARNAPLPTGEYTLELRAGAITATRTFRLVGDAASLTLSEPQGSRALGGRITFTAALTDADGATVADGTPVVWQESSTTPNIVLVQLAADTRTTGGEASATYLVIGSGAGVVRATSGEAADARAIFDLGAPPESAVPHDPAASLSSRTPGGLATYLGDESATASELLAALGGVAAISLWRDEVWLSYRRPNGEQPAESVDFTVGPGDILHLHR